MDNAIAQWISVVTAAVAVAAIVAVARTLSGKANKSDIEAIGKALGDKASKADVDGDFVDLRDANVKQADEGLRQYRELKTAIEGIQKEISALDKNSLTKSDLIEMKGDIKELVKGVAESQKTIDSIPDRLLSLEATRNKQSEK